MGRKLAPDPAGVAHVVEAAPHSVGVYGTVGGGQGCDPLYLHLLLRPHHRGAVPGAEPPDVGLVGGLAAGRDCRFTAVGRSSFPMGHLGKRPAGFLEQ